MSDLRVIHAGLSVRAATAVQLALTGATDPLAVQFANYLADELRARPALPVTVISDEGVTTGLLNADDSITVPEPAAKRVARKMAKAGAKAAG